ncbi:MAG TPA: SDR family oxidoreductase [Gemmatimonadales bacterium]
MRVLILGGTGMLGHKLWQQLAPAHETTVTVRGDAAALDPVAQTLGAPARVIEHVAADEAGIRRALQIAHPDAVINAVGIVKQSDIASDAAVMHAVNAAFPHLLAEHCRRAGVRLIHISTDCVFAGTNGRYTETDRPDPEDLYGRSKLDGEVTGPGCLTLRTSMIGRELAGQRGLVEWFLAQRGGRVRGFTKAVFSGLSTALLARVIADLLERHPHLDGLYHVAAGAVTKHDLLHLLSAAYHLPVTIDAYDGVVLDRSLDGTKFRDATGFVAPAWPELVRLMAADPAPYDRWRASRGS